MAHRQCRNFNIKASSKGKNQGDDGYIVASVRILAETIGNLSIVFSILE
jgi:hypothetical protein